MAECALRRHVLNMTVVCDEDRCLFWDHLGIQGAGGQPQCAVQYFSLLGKPGEEIAEWLLRLKDRADLEQTLGLGTDEAVTYDGDGPAPED